MENYINEYMEIYKNCKAYKFKPEMVLNNNQRIIMGSLDIAVNTYCTLKCKGCASLISLYDKGSNQQIEVVLDALDKLLNNVNVILRVNILGGEPFLYPDLRKLISYMNKQEKIQKVYVMTNGTVFLEDLDLVKDLKDSKNEVRISEYVSFKKKQGGLKTYLKQNGISCTVKTYSNGKFQWYYYGNFAKRKRTEQEKHEQMKNCSVEAQYLYNGKLYMCPRIAHGCELGLIPRADDDRWITFADDTAEDIQRKLHAMIFRKYLYTACDYCNRGTNDIKQISVAEQFQ